MFFFFFLSINSLSLVYLANLAAGKSSDGYGLKTKWSSFLFRVFHINAPHYLLYLIIYDLFYDHLVLFSSLVILLHLLSKLSTL